MQRCIDLALLGAGNTAPNPMVGAVLVYGDRVIGEGYHEKYGEAHAEVNCINAVSPENRKLIPESVLYVSLEPCSHHGKTPPCADLIVREKIPRVVIGCIDSFSAVAGKGIEKLRAAGVETETGILEKECRLLNKRFFTFHEQGRPYIILKWAQSADGKIAGPGGERIKISNEFTDRLVHRWRSEEAAIFAGANTVVKDDPALTVRLWKGNHPVRVTFDEKVTLPLSSQIFDGQSPLLVLNRVKEDDIFFQLKDNEDLPEGLCRCLRERKLLSVIIEGGSKSLQAFIDKGCWDEARVITNEELTIGEGVAAPVLSNQSATGTEQIINDRTAYYRRKGNEFL